MAWKSAAILLVAVLLGFVYLVIAQEKKSQNPDSGVEILSPVPEDQLPLFEKQIIPNLIKKTRQAWYPLIPLEARPPQSEKGQLTIQFVLHSDGKVSDMRIVTPSGYVALDRAAWGGITGAVPYNAFPSAVSVETVKLQFTFRYNIPAPESASR